MKKSPHVHRNSASFIRYYGNQNLTLSLLAETLPASSDMPLFDYPFNELMVSISISSVVIGRTFTCRENLHLVGFGFDKGERKVLEVYIFKISLLLLQIWAVLTKRQQMALLMWQHGEEALAKSLVSCKLYKAMAHEAAEDDLETEVYEELRNYGKEFENIGECASRNAQIDISVQPI